MFFNGSANSIGGQTVVIKLRWGQPAAKLPFEGALPGIKFRARPKIPNARNFSVPGREKALPRFPYGRRRNHPAPHSPKPAITRNAWDAYNKKAARWRKKPHPSAP